MARMDLAVEVVSVDEATRMVHFRVLPDPRRYIRTERDGETYYLDRYLKYAISERAMRDMCANQTVAMPLHHLPSSVSSASDYAAARRAALNKELKGSEYIAPAEAAAQHRQLEETGPDKQLVFLSVDICGSTALRRANPAMFERAYAIFLRELGTVVGQFHGAILKTTGDGFIAYIDYPAFTQQGDNAVDMALTFLVVLRDSINPALGQVGLPELSIRIGGDYGNAKVRQVKVPLTGFSQPEIASDALNRAVKIEKSSQENEFRVGRALYEILHVQWLERAEEVSFDANTVGIPGYKTYRIS